MALQHFQLLAVFEADQILGRDRLADRHSGFQHLGHNLDYLSIE